MCFGARFFFFYVALRPRERGSLLGTRTGRGGGGGGGRKSEGSTSDTARKRPERPWTAARTMEVLKRCPLAIAQRLVHCCFNCCVWAESQRQCPLHCCCALGRFYSHISTRTFRKALTASLDSCAEIKSAPSVA